MTTRCARWALVFSVLAGCGGGAPAGDAAPDAARDTSDVSASDVSASDALSDASSDALSDASSDALSDASSDAGASDAGVDASSLDAATRDAAGDGASDAPSASLDAVALDAAQDAAPARDAVVDAAFDGPSMPEAAVDAAPAVDAVAPSGPPFCSLGVDVPGLRPPEGFCLRRYATVRHARTLAFAPNGDLFVGAPRTFSPGGSGGGPGAVLLLTDDDRDGVAEERTFASTRRDAAGALSAGLNDVHGVAVGGGYLYFTTAAQVFRTPYALGQRAETMGAVESLGLPVEFGSVDPLNPGRWTHGLARSASGALYTSRGEYSSCGSAATGSISRVDRGVYRAVATGFRNPMYLRCHFRDELCMAAELGEDGQSGAVEKLVVLRDGEGYGYPCCQSRGRAAPGGTAEGCAAVALEERSFPLGDTPFGFDWERGSWPERYRGALFVAMHGSYYSSTPRWRGAGLRVARTDPRTHLPTEEFVELLGRAHGVGEGLALVRPADAAFSPDGRLFIADDHGGAVYWVAPTTLRMPAR